MLDGFANASEISTGALIVLKRLTLFSMELLQTMFELFLSRFPAKEVLKNERNQNVWTLIMNYSLESLHNETGYTGKVRHSCIKELLL